MFFGNVERPPRLSEFDLEVPEKCIGQHPAKKRDECKLMILDKKSGDIQHKKFKDITWDFTILPGEMKSNSVIKNQESIIKGNYSRGSSNLSNIIINQLYGLSSRSDIKI